MKYKSPLRKLVKFFENSRDNWKQKYQQARKDIKSLKNKRYYQQQKQRSQEQRLMVLSMENKALRASLAALEQQQQKDAAFNEKAEHLLEATSAFDQKIAHHQYSVGLIQMLLQLVFDGANHLRTSARSMAIMGNVLPDIDTDVSWYSVRLWAMRLGYDELTRTKEKANDWIWIVDHSIQLSHEKCLVIVGFRLSTIGKNRHPLHHQDLNLISLEIVKQSNGAVVCEQLSRFPFLLRKNGNLEAVKKTGIPRAIIHDHGSELKAGITQFQTQHTETASIYDIKHKVALEIKHRLEQDTQWDTFNKTASTIDKRLRQTAHAHFVPPKLRIALHEP